MAKGVYQIEVRRNRVGTWFYRLRAPNGEVMLSGQSYQTRGGARRGATAFTKLLACDFVVKVQDA